MAYLAIRARRAGAPNALSLPRAFDGVAVALIAFNALLLVGGALEWGARVAATGAVALAAIVPISLLCRRRRERRILAPPPVPAAVEEMVG
jgi:hypothetical protein